MAHQAFHSPWPGLSRLPGQVGTTPLGGQKMWSPPTGTQQSPQDVICTVLWPDVANLSFPPSRALDVMALCSNLEVIILLTMLCCKPPEGATSSTVESSPRVAGLGQKTVRGSCTKATAAIRPSRWCERAIFLASKPKSSQEAVTVRGTKAYRAGVWPIPVPSRSPTAIGRRAGGP